MVFSHIKPSSYYDNHFRQGTSLQRARRPYLVRNAVTGLGVCLFTVSVYIYTLKAIGTDDFDDVQPVKRADTDKA